jgi:hypothetical protein
MLKLVTCLAFVFLAACSTSPVSEPAEQREHFSFVAVMVSDVDVSAAWYARTFGLSEANRATSDTYDVRVLRSDELLVELIELNPLPPDPEGRVRGISKAGFEISDWDARVAAWRAAGVPFFNDRVLFDEALQLHNVIIVDPDGNMIQVFARAE